jgi:RHS repeat-associated protein
VAYDFLYNMDGSKLAVFQCCSLNYLKLSLPLPGGASAVYNWSGLQYYRHPDWLGTTRLATSPGRGVVYDGAVAPFGEAYAQTGNIQGYSFTGQEQEVALELFDFAYREYHTTQGRWISPDPAGLAAVDPADPQTWNRYAYVRNNPLNGELRIPGDDEKDSGVNAKSVPG